MSQLSADKKYELQQNYKRYENHYQKGRHANEMLKQAKASRVWMLGVIALLFSMQSAFFLGVGAALIGMYCFQIICAYIQKAQAEDVLEDVERWFNLHGLVFNDTTVFHKDDAQLEQPVDLFNDKAYQ